MQVMNDEGVYMFPTLRGQVDPRHPGAAPGHPASGCASWNAFSNSRPVEGIEAAIRTFGRPGRKISLYVLGDEFTGDSIDAGGATRWTGSTAATPAASGRSASTRIGFPTLFSPVPVPRDHRDPLLDPDAPALRAKRRRLRRPQLHRHPFRPVDIKMRLPYSLMHANDRQSARHADRAGPPARLGDGTDPDRLHCRCGEGVTRPATRGSESASGPAHDVSGLGLAARCRPGRQRGAAGPHGRDGCC